MWTSLGSPTPHRALAAIIVGGGLVLAFGAPADASPEPNDPRAELIPGNVQIGDCPDGTELLDAPADFTFSGGNTQPSVSILTVAEGVVVTDIYVKGGNDTNHYEPGERGLAGPPFSGLIAPENDGGNTAAVSHWFACGTTDEPPPPDDDDPPPPDDDDPPPPDDDDPPPPDETDPTVTTVPSDPTGPRPQSADPAPTTTAKPALPVTGASENLAMAVAASMLVTTGVGALIVARRRA